MVSSEFGVWGSLLRTVQSWVGMIRAGGTTGAGALLFKSDLFQNEINKYIININI